VSDNPFPDPASVADLEEGGTFAPRFNADGLIPAMALDAETQAPLMFAWMNAHALSLTLETGIAHYWSRSRGKLWKKGETSGQTQTVVRIRTDCDQDVVVIDVQVNGDGAACHTGRATCFYREVGTDGSLEHHRRHPAAQPGRRLRPLKTIAASPVFADTPP
jgi:phosphoribosyl-AMP cyclohydrolase